MRTKFLLLLCILMSICVDVNAKKRSLKISAMPSDAKISIDGNYVGDGVIEYPITKKDNFLVIRIEKEGYLPVETKYYTSDKRNAVSYTLRQDLFYESSTPNGNVNKFFSVEVSKDLYSIGKDGKKDTEKAWKLIHQILLNYFDELQTTDISSGFIQTPWKYRQFGESKQVIRTRVTVKQMGISDDKLIFQIKISSEQAPLIGMNNENSYSEVTRLLKEYDSLISEFQSRLSVK